MLIKTCIAGPIVVTSVLC